MYETIGNPNYVPLSEISALGEKNIKPRNLEELDKHVKGRQGLFINRMMNLGIKARYSQQALGFQEIIHLPNGELKKYPDNPDGDNARYTGYKMCTIGSIGLLRGIKLITDPGYFSVRLLQTLVFYEERGDFEVSYLWHNIVEVMEIARLASLYFDVTFGQVNHCFSDRILSFKREEMPNFYPIAGGEHTRVIQDVTIFESDRLADVQATGISNEDLWGLAKTLN
jgi:hypothetical protein